MRLHSIKYNKLLFMSSECCNFVRKRVVIKTGNIPKSLSRAVIPNNWYQATDP